jgi:cyclopropane fatty-acyl-phospholipid synthase-like methyltransferase
MISFFKSDACSSVMFSFSKTALEYIKDLVEIGSGWGGFAIYAAQHYGCRVTTITISQAQYFYK